MVETRANILERILDAELDSAYQDLYGYTPEVQRLYTDVLSDLQMLDNTLYGELLKETQNVILKTGRLTHSPVNAELGNILRSEVVRLETVFKEIAELIDRDFRTAMLKLINASDSAIYKKDFREPIFVRSEDLGDKVTLQEKAEMLTEALLRASRNECS